MDAVRPTLLSTTHMATTSSVIIKVGKIMSPRIPNLTLMYKVFFYWSYP